MTGLYRLWSTITFASVTGRPSQNQEIPIPRQNVEMHIGAKLFLYRRRKPPPDYADDSFQS
jgi:hypothetical protein